ncbi:hypothetical protein GFK26_18365 [Variovorax paradoxus]|uniref:Uncharacterized protein n=1 Tax=Variovorax paradoxus TaxID=34073 RepID=A0A5Q0M4X8_VARPD|nr:hypothetical protein [Variovorax paradoxus]QFZ84593.1 hypothetical protein GFK26_18365 [Variovorax paradoxus]
MDSGIASLIGVGVGVFAANGAKVIEHYVHRRRAAQYLAVRLVTVLDRFIAGCVPVTEDEGRVLPGSYDLEPVATLPTLEFDSLDVDWKSIKPHLTYAVLALPNEVAEAVRSINANFDPSNVPSVDFSARQFHFARLGIAANDLIGRLAGVGGLAHYSPDRRRLTRALELAFERRTQQRESWMKEMIEFRRRSAEAEKASIRVMREAHGEVQPDMPAEKKPDQT